MNIFKNKHYISFKKLDEYNIINLFTIKPYNFRSNQISKEDIKKQYNSIENDLNTTFKYIISPNQNHTNNVCIVNENNIFNNFDNVDGLITNLKNVALVTKIADCQGIILLDQKHQVIGNIHSGWKGTLTRILTNAINLMIKEFNSNTKDIEIFISPSILSCCFEVDTDVKDLFLNNFNDIDINSCIKPGKVKENKQKYYIDTVKINELVALNLGIKKEHIYLSNICSKCNSNFIHSHRENNNSGRNILLVCLK